LIVNDFIQKIILTESLHHESYSPEYVTT